MTRRPIFLAFALFVVMAALATFTLLTGDEPAEDTGQRVRPLRLPAEPTWSAELHLEPEVLGGTVLVQRDTTLHVLDAETGTTRWSVTQGEELRDGGGSRAALWPESTGLVTREGRPAVLMEDFRCVDCAVQDLVIAPVGERALTLLSAEDGQVLWRTVLTPVGSEGSVQGMVADDRMVLVSFVQGRLQDGDLSSVTMAYDLRDGTQMWTAVGWPVAIAGDVALLHIGSGPPSVDPGIGVLQKGAVHAVSATTGQPAWDLTGLYDRTELLLVAGDVAFVRGADEGKQHSRGVMVTLDRGRLLEEVGYGSFDGCATDRTDLIACPRDGALLTFQVADGRLTTVPTKVQFGTVGEVWKDRIFVRYGSDTLSIDREGRLVDENLPGDLVGRAGDVLLLSTEDAETGEETLHGYRLRQ